MNLMWPYSNPSLEQIQSKFLQSKVLQSKQITSMDHRFRFKSFMNLMWPYSNPNLEQNSIQMHSWNDHDGAHNSIKIQWYHGHQNTSSNSIKKQKQYWICNRMWNPTQKKNASLKSNWRINPIPKCKFKKPIEGLLPS